MADADPIAEKENFESGPLSLLTKVVKDNSQVPDFFRLKSEARSFFYVISNYSSICFS